MPSLVVEFMFFLLLFLAHYYHFSAALGLQCYVRILLAFVTIVLSCIGLDWSFGAKDSDIFSTYSMSLIDAVANSAVDARASL